MRGHCQEVQCLLCAAGAVFRRLQSAVGPASRQVFQASAFRGVECRSSLASEPWLWSNETQYEAHGTVRGASAEWAEPRQARSGEGPTGPTRPTGPTGPPNPTAWKGQVRNQGRSAGAARAPHDPPTDGCPACAGTKEWHKFEHILFGESSC